MRSLAENSDQIPTLFQGPHPDKKGEVYPGDGRIRGHAGLTIQMHTLCVRTHDGTTLIADDVPAVAVWVPSDMAADWISQDQGGSP